MIMDIKEKSIGIAFSGSFCTYKKAFIELERLIACNCNVYTIFSERSASINSRFGNADDFIKKAQNIHGLKYDYSKVEYKNAKDKVCLICLKHGEFWQTPNDHLSGKGCPSCNESHLEREVKNILDKNNIEYISQYKIKWLRKQSLDFYLPDYNIVIECQGKQHFGFGGWSENFNFKQQFELDKIKKELCELNNFKIIYVVDNNLVDKIPDFITYKEDVISIKELDECIKQMK